MSISWLVLITGMIAEIQLYAEAQKRAQLLTLALGNSKETDLVLSGSLVLLAVVGCLRVDSTIVPSGLIHLLGACGCFFGVWLALLGVATGGHPIRFLWGSLRAPR